MAIVMHFRPSVPIPTLLPPELYDGGLWFGMYLTVFTLSYFSAKLLFDRFSALSFIVVIIAITSVLLRVTNKPIVLAAFVSLLCVIIVMLFVYHRGGAKFAWGVAVVSLLSMLVFSAFPQIKGGIFSTFADRFYKIQVDSSRMEQASVIDLVMLARDVEIGGAKDVTAGRFDLWKGYLSAGLEYPLVTPYFGNRPSIYIEAMGREVEFSPHNSVVHYIYFVGLPAGIALTLLMVFFVAKGWNALKLVDRGVNTGLKPFQGAAVFAFVLSVFAVEMVGGPLTSSVAFAWFFWALVTIFLYGSSLIKKNVEYG